MENGHISHGKVQIHGFVVHSIKLDAVGCVQSTSITKNSMIMRTTLKEYSIPLSSYRPSFH